ncbi:hypothetical protein ACO0LO_17055 [Undibacterium sp. TJN25]|uniref:hypothetical protein n=1 Tax=Undibacterium sp. TJN25 TaxID=3413056 RepID=UPI003BF37C93
MENAAPFAARDAWMVIVRQADRMLFAEHFDLQATLTTSVFERVIKGADEIYRYFEATRAMFDSFAFNSEVSHEGRTFMTWEGHALEKTLTGVTIVERNPAGLVTKVEIYSGPLSALTPFATDLERRLKERVAPT